MKKPYVKSGLPPGPKPSGKPKKPARRKGRLVLVWVPKNQFPELEDLCRETGKNMTRTIAWALHQQWLLMRGMGPEYDSNQGSDLIF